MLVRSQEAVQLNRVSVACSLGFITLPVCREWVVGLDKGSFEDRLVITGECLCRAFLIKVFLNVRVSKYLLGFYRRL